MKALLGVQDKWIDEDNFDKIKYKMVDHNKTLVLASKRSTVRAVQKSYIGSLNFPIFNYVGET